MYILKNIYGYHLTVGLSCSRLLCVYLFRFQLYLWFVFATMIMVNKDYHNIYFYCVIDFWLVVFQMWCGQTHRLIHGHTLLKRTPASYSLSMAFG